MPAVAEESVYQKTTAAILENTSHKPLHMWADRSRLALERVSSKSAWGGPRWVFDNPTSGSRDNASTINWSLDLPDGNNLLDPRHVDLVDWLRRFVWSTFAAPGDGAAGLKPGSLSSVGVGLR